MYLFLSLKERQSSILWSVLCRFHWLYHCYHSLSVITICCHSLSLVVLLVVTLYQIVAPLVATRCTARCHWLSLVVTRCHSLPLVVPLVVTRCHSLSLVVIRCHSLSLDVPLVCLFINDRIYILLHIRKHYLMHICCWFLKSSKAFSVPLRYYSTLNFWKIQNLFESY